MRKAREQDTHQTQSGEELRAEKGEWKKFQ